MPDPAPLDTCDWRVGAEEPTYRRGNDVVSGEARSSAIQTTGNGAMLVHMITIATLAGDFWKNRGLILSLTLREIAARYRGTVAGIFWALFHPLLMLAIYTFVFSVIFKARWGQEGESDAQYALVLFIGLIVFQIFAECISRAPTLITGNVNYVKKVVFPLETLPWSAMGAALFQAGISLMVWFVAHLVLVGLPPVTGLLFPVVILPFLFFVMGVSWWLASLGVYVRDIAQVSGIVVTMLFFMSPIFYPISVVPEKFIFLYKMNPITYAVEQARDVLFFGRAPDPAIWCLYAILALAVAWLGFAWFQKTRKGFADVL